MNKNLGFNEEVWNNTEAKEMGEFESLKLGGHEVKIISAELYQGLTGNTSLKVCVDIAGNDEQKGFFTNKDQYNNNTDKKWPAGATRYMPLKEENLAYTKGFITSLEKSNNGFKFDTSKGWEQLNDLVCAGVFGLEEFEDNDGNIKVATKLVQFRSLDKLNEIKIPRVKTLNGTYVDYEEYNSTKSEVKKTFDTDVVEISDEELPF